MKSHMLIILAASLFVNTANAENLTTTECVDGMTVAVIHDAASTPVHGYQLLDEEGTPIMCGDRLAAHTLKWKKAIEYQNEAFRLLRESVNTVK